MMHLHFLEMAELSHQIWYQEFNAFPVVWSAYYHLLLQESHFAFVDVKEEFRQIVWAQLIDSV